MKILLIGPQGSGKSTQAKLLSEFLKMPLISTGNIYRGIASTDEIIKKILNEGGLVDDQTTSRIVKDRLSQPDCRQGFIIDGYPRTIEQVKLFDPEFNLVIYLDVLEEEVIKRLMERGRTDDTLELIKRRLELYYEQTQPLLDYYKNQGILKEVHGMGSIKEVQNEIRKHFSK